MVAEQNTGTDSLGTYQHLLTPTPPPSRSHSAQGQRREERHRDRERSTESRDDRRSNRADLPVGAAFRVQAVETSLAQHFTEIQSQRLEIDQLKQMVQVLMTSKEETARELHNAGVKLEACFGHVDSKFTEAMGKIEQSHGNAMVKFENLTAIVNGVAQTTQGRLDSLSAVIDQIQAHPVTQNSTHGAFQVHQGPTVSQAPPSAPLSWAGSQAPVISPSPAFGIGAESDPFRTAAQQPPLIQQPAAFCLNEATTFGAQRSVQDTPLRRTHGQDTSFHETFST